MRETGQNNHGDRESIRMSSESNKEHRGLRCDVIWRPAMQTIVIN